MSRKIGTQITQTLRAQIDADILKKISEDQRFISVYQRSNSGL
jgi:hypothetical protein